MVEAIATSTTDDYPPQSASNIVAPISLTDSVTQCKC